MAVLNSTEKQLTESQMERYSRQLLLPEIGVSGQLKLMKSKVLFIGAGGLGSPASIYLAAAGVGCIGLVDCDRVDRSNLHRQILHFEDQVGQYKTTSAKAHLRKVNPDINIVEHQTIISSANAIELISDYDVIINGSDNFPTRYLVNDACVLLGKPLVDASILKWEGSVSVFMPRQGCYRCLFPKPPKPGDVASCSEAGIVGAIAGMMGSYQTMEAIKIILGLEHVLSHQTLMFNALTGHVQTIQRKRRSSCPICGDQPTIHELIDYHEFCGLPQTNNEPSHSEQNAQLSAPIGKNYCLAIDDAKQWLHDPDTLWVDIREDEDEFAQGHIPGSKHIPFSELNEHLDNIMIAKRVIFICQIGKRSKFAVRKCVMEGFYEGYNLDEGLLGWENHGLPINQVNMEGTL